MSCHVIFGFAPPRSGAHFGPRPGVRLRRGRRRLVGRRGGWARDAIGLIDAGGDEAEERRRRSRSAPGAEVHPPVPIIGGKKVDYVLTVGAIPLRDGKGTVTGEIVYTSYVVSQKEGPGRPVTFSLNGGPGAASAYLNLGAIGPKHIHFGRNGVYASQSGALNDNPNSWLDFTDLVFIDPIGTGYSRSHLGVEATRKTFLTSETDVHYLAEAIDLWLSESGRMLSPKYLIGESYGGYRVPRLAAICSPTWGSACRGLRWSRLSSIPPR